MSMRTLSEHIFAAENNKPWLVPTLVEWQSVVTLDENNDIIIQDGIIETAMDYPIVALTNCYSPISENRFMSDNVHLEWDFDRAFFECEPWQVNDSFRCLGVVPMWTILPIREEFVDSFIKTINDLASRAKLDVLQWNCMCSLDGYHSEECASNNYTPQGYGDCDCNFVENIVDTMSHLLDNLPVVEEYLTEEQNKIWSFAKQQYEIGWQVLYNLANTEKESENTWAYYSWQQQSPYWDSPGLEINPQKESNALTNLETQQAS